jgi:hypothetical protein
VVSFSLSYTGNLADRSLIDMYDAGRGLAAFHRSLALTTHLILNGEIITQAPSLKGAQIITTIPEEGSWKVTAVVLAGVWAVASSPKDSVPGHLLYSAYDYVVNSTLGFHVDFSKSLGEQYEEELARKKITAEKMDSLIEKTENSIGDLHRPVVASKTATQADIVAHFSYGDQKPVGPPMTYLTYDYISKTVRSDDNESIEGVVSSFNINTFRGRIFVFSEQRPIPFELAIDARGGRNLVTITSSLQANAAKLSENNGGIRLIARRLLSSTGRLKALIVSSVQSL